MSEEDPGETYRGSVNCQVRNNVNDRYFCFRRSEGGEADRGHTWEQFLQDSGDRQLQQERPESDADQLCQPVLI